MPDDLCPVPFLIIRTPSAGGDQWDATDGRLETYPTNRQVGNLPHVHMKTVAPLANVGTLGAISRESREGCQLAGWHPWRRKLAPLAELAGMQKERGGWRTNPAAGKRDGMLRTGRLENLPYEQMKLCASSRRAQHLREIPAVFSKVLHSPTQHLREPDLSIFDRS